MRHTKLHTLSDKELQRQIEDLVRDSRRTTAELLAHLIEVERREMHLEMGYSSLFGYCTERLFLERGAAYLRIRAARLSRRFPRVLTMLASGQIQLASLPMLASKLTERNHRKMLDAACGKSRREIEALLVAQFPLARPRQSVRKLPARDPKPETLPLIAIATGRQVDNDPKPEKQRASQPNPTLSFGLRPGTLGQRRKSLRPVTPISGSLFKVQFTASASLVRKLNAAKALSSHRNPKGDLEPLFEQALTLLVQQLEKERFAKTAKPRKSQRKKTKSLTTQTAVPGNTSADVEMSRSGASATEVEAGKRRSRHVPNSVKRLVYERDAGRCTFVGTDGRRCNETHMLEYEHKVPWARGGGHSLENVVLMCRAHNQLRARQEFGCGNLQLARPRTSLPREAEFGPD